MSDQSSSATPMFNIQIDGVWHQFPKGTRVIEACEQAGSYVPRYCYHKKLSSPGNCRMCLIEMGFPKLGPDRKPELGPDDKPIINWMPRPQISCAQDVAEGIGVRTNSPLVKECQRGVMEFLLINVFSKTKSRNLKTSYSGRASRSMMSAAFFARAAFVSARKSRTTTCSASWIAAVTRY